MQIRTLLPVLGALVLAPIVARADAAELEAKCRAGETLACFQAAQAIEGTDVDKAIELLAIPCENGKETGNCGWLSGLADRAFDRGETSRAVAVSERACRARAESCENLAFRYEHGVQTPRDLAKAAELHEKACAAKSSSACLAYSRMLRDARGVARDETKATELKKRAFEMMKEQEKKQQASDAVLANSVKSADPKKLEASCRSREPGQCYRYMWRMGPAERARVIDVTEAACKEASDKATEPCFLLTSLGESARAQGDAAGAQEIHRRGCDAGAASGCALGGAMLADGFDVPRDDAKAVGILRRGCDLGALMACLDLSEMTLEGRGTPKDAAKATALMDRAKKLLHEGMQKVAQDSTKRRQQEDDRRKAEDDKKRADAAEAELLAPFTAKLEALAEEAKAQEAERKGFDRADPDQADEASVAVTKRALERGQGWLGRRADRQREIRALVEDLGKIVR
jgi:TPR repeat protein